MKNKIFLLVLVISIMIFLHHPKGRTKTPMDHSNYTKKNISETVIDNGTLTFISICSISSREIEVNKNHPIMREMYVLLKSAVMLTKRTLRWLVLTENDNIKKYIEDKVSKWPKEYINLLQISYHLPVYPSGHEPLKYLWGGFGTVRIYSHDMFPDLDAAIYVDTDFIFLKRPEELWEEFHKFNHIQLLAMTPDCGHLISKRKKPIPYYPPGGLNSGLMMMNLTRMRRMTFYNLSTSFEGNWNAAMFRVYDTYKDSLLLPEQDMLNIFFVMNPELVYVLGFQWNFNVLWCMVPDLAWKRIFTEIPAASMIQGNMHSFFPKRNINLRVVFNAFENHRIGSPVKKFLTSLKNPLGSSKKRPSKCAHIKNLYEFLTRELENYI